MAGTDGWHGHVGLDENESRLGARQKRKEFNQRVTESVQKCPNGAIKVYADTQYNTVLDFGEQSYGALL